MEASPASCVRRSRATAASSRAVVNAIDDHLAKDDQLATPWSATYVPVAASAPRRGAQRRAARVLASDHGHVLDHGGTAATVARTRRALPLGDPARRRGRAARRGDARARARRACVLAVDEDIRYSPRKHGYHGGGSPQEVLAPLLVLAPGLAEGLDGWVETAYDPPAWWTGRAPPEPVPAIAPAPAAPEPVEGPDGQLALPDEAPPAASDAGSGVDRRAARGRDVRRSAIRGQPRPRARRADHRHPRRARRRGRQAAARCARARASGSRPMRLRGTLAAMRQLLNVDGYPVLSVDEDTGDVVLDVALLREQFELGASP